MVIPCEGLFDHLPYGLFLAEVRGGGEHLFSPTRQAVHLTKMICLLLTYRQAPYLGTASGFHKEESSFLCCPKALKQASKKYGFQDEPFSCCSHMCHGRLIWAMVAVSISEPFCCRKAQKGRRKPILNPSNPCLLTIALAHKVLNGTDCSLL